jgi:hydroxysqualene dehydroxylase
VVAIIGGGFAGLSAAVALAGAGEAVQLFEARPTLGGRANTFRDPETGERVDNGQHILAGCYVETLALLDRLGSASLLHWPSALRLQMIDESGRPTELRFPALPAPLNLLAGILAWDALSLQERWSILRMGSALRGDTRVRPDETVRQWLTRHQQSTQLCRLFWEPLALAALNQSIDDAAASMFVAVTSRMFGGDANASAILVPGAPLHDLYVQPAIQFLATHGASVSTHAKAQIVVHDGKVTGVRVGDQHHPSPTVICAVPWFAMADMFTTDVPAMRTIVSNATTLGSAPIVTVNVWWDTWRSRHAMFGLPGRAFQWVFDRRQYVDGGAEHLSLVSSGAEAICARPNDELIALAIRELRQALPELRHENVRHAAVIRERRATFSLAPGSPPRPSTTTPIAGLFLAGDWIDTGLPATIESAVVAGNRAAAATLHYLH